MQVFKMGDRMEVVSGKFKGHTGTVINNSKMVPGGVYCHLESLKPSVKKVLLPGQIRLIVERV